MDEEKKLNIDYIVIRRVANGWIIDLSNYNRADYPSPNSMFVFPTLDELFAWIRLQAE